MPIIIAGVVGLAAVWIAWFWPTRQSVDRERVLEDWREACGEWRRERAAEIIAEHWTGERE